MRLQSKRSTFAWLASNWTVALPTWSDSCPKSQDQDAYHEGKLDGYQSNPQLVEGIIADNRGFGGWHCDDQLWIARLLLNQ